MPKEIEIKILDVDHDQVVRRLRALRARKVGHYRFKRIIFSLMDNGKRQRWIRLRTDGKTHTLTLKDKSGSGIMQTEELETEVEDFPTTARMLCMALPNPMYEENERTEYMLGRTQVTLDKWPQIPWLVEIEGKSERDVRRVQRLLAIGGRDVGNISQIDAYRIYGIDVGKAAKRNRGRLARLIGGHQKSINI